MIEKKGVQEMIVRPAEPSSKVEEEEFLSILKSISPGTNLRAGMEGIVKAENGALIVIENENLLPIMDGGFRVNCRFTPQRLIELSKMDGAIILSKDMKKINYANVLLTPDSRIKSLETGTRHKAAERTAKQINGLVIAISERKKEINIFYKNIKYLVKETEEILRKANEHIQMIEKHREDFDKIIEKLTIMEIKNYPSINKASLAIQKGKVILKIAEELKKDLIELGNEGVLMKSRLKELLSGVEKEINLIIKDYTRIDFKHSRMLLDSLNYDELLEIQNIYRILNYENVKVNFPIKGWRVLSKTSLSEADIARLLKERESLGEIIHTSPRSYYEILGEEKAQMLKNEIEKIKINI